jgi:hypothetical protein
MKNLIILLSILLLISCSPSNKQRPPVTFPICDFSKAPFGSAPRGYGVLVPAIPKTLHPISLSTVSITDTALLRRVLVQDVKAMRTESNRLNVYARIINCTDFPIILEARTQYLDSNQVISEPVTGWKRMHLPARTLGNYQETSISQPMPDSFLIELREQL